MHASGATTDESQQALCMHPPTLSRQFNIGFVDSSTEYTLVSYLHSRTAIGHTKSQIMSHNQSP